MTTTVQLDGERTLMIRDAQSMQESAADEPTADKPDDQEYEALPAISSPWSTSAEAVLAALARGHQDRSERSGG